MPKNIQCNGDELTLSNCTFIEYNPQECQQVAGVICEGVFYSNTISDIIYLTLFCFQPTAPCLSNGVTDCNECSNAADCPPIPSAQCYCTSECYKNGMCCPDVGHLQNCLGNTYNSCCVLIFMYMLMLLYTQKKNVKQERSVWWVVLTTPQVDCWRCVLMEDGALCVTTGMSGIMRMLQLSVVNSTYLHPVSSLNKQ